MKYSFSRFTIITLIVTIVFLQPSIQCNSDKKTGSAARSSTNPIYAKSANTGYQWEASAPDEIIASEVKLKPGAVEIPDGDMNMMEKADLKSGLYVFDGSADLDDLKPNTFVFFRNHSVRKINSVQSENGKWVVRTSKCKFTDVFSDAHLHFREKYTWKDNAKAILDKFNVSFGNTAYAQDGEGGESGDGAGEGGGSNLSQSISWEGTVRGYKVKITLQPEGGQKLNYDINVKRESKANITFKGFISDYTNETELTVSNSELQLFRSQNQQLRGEVEVQFAAVELGDDGEMLNIPWTMFERPILIGGIPFIFKTKANVKVFPFIGQNASSQGHFKFTYDSNIGFQYEGRRVSAEGNVAANTMEVIGETVSASMMGNGIGMGVEFPRFEISSLGEIVVPYFLINTAVDTQVDTYRPCQMGNMKCKLVAGLSLSFFGASYNAERELWKGQKRWEREGSRCPPAED